MAVVIPPTVANLDEVLLNSFKDFHTKGFDYLCIRRSPVETIKLYFFDGDVSKLPEVVSPHDHRYDFATYILAGSSENVWYTPDEAGEVFNRFEYRTPLNGGNGFTFADEVRLAETHRRRFSAGGHYWMEADGLHTIRMREPETVLMLRQFEDRVPLDRPTSTFCRGDAPGMSGLYNRFTADQVRDKLRVFGERTGIRIELL